MPSRHELSSFIRSTFRSVWSLELLCFLRRNRERAWTQGELVTALRASDLVVTQSLELLLAAGLVAIEPGALAQYCPVSDEVDAMVAATEQLYATRPDTVRRMIVSARSEGLATFADAFKLRRD